MRPSPWARHEIQSMTSKGDQVQQVEVECLDSKRDCKYHEGAGEIRPWQQRGGSNQSASRDERQTQATRP
jgi:hypothetical protein